MKQIARVEGSTMYAYPGSPPAEVDSKIWFDWLKRRDSFSYHDPAYGSCTVRCEKAKNGDGYYWRAYRTCEKKLHKVYLGTASSVTLARLQEAATTLACPEPAPAPWDQEYSAEREYFPDKDTMRQAQREIHRLESAKRLKAKDRRTLLAIADAALTDLAGARAVIAEYQTLLEAERQQRRR